MRVAIVASKVNSITSELMENLAQRGAEVRLICPEKQVTDLADVRVEDDLYVLKSVGHLGLGIAGALHAAGARTLNPYPKVALVKHKVVVNHVLHSAGVPVPATFTTTDPTALLPLLKESALIAKPFDGARSEGIQILRTRDDLKNVHFGEFLMVQRYYEPDEPGRFIKAYYLDGQIFLRKRWWSDGQRRNKESEPVEASSALARIVEICARALGLKLFGLDIVIRQGKPFVVDVQEFGSFAGVAQAPILLADFIFSHLNSALKDRSANAR